MKSQVYFAGLQGGDKSGGVHAQTDGERQLDNAKKIGLGIRNYNLINL